MKDSGTNSLSRRDMIVAGAAASVFVTTSKRSDAGTSKAPQPALEQASGPAGSFLVVSFTVNGALRNLELDARTTLLDALREQLQLTGTKKGCDHGQCGACTVIVDGRRINSCLTLALMQEGRSITTIEGLGSLGTLHPMQAAFVRHDGYQCGYCTPGQICSAIAVLNELEAGIPSHVTDDLGAPPHSSRSEFQERMSGNICRCGAYSNIIEAITDVASNGT